MWTNFLKFTSKSGKPTIQKLLASGTKVVIDNFKREFNRVGLTAEYLLFGSQLNAQIQAPNMAIYSPTTANPFPIHQIATPVVQPTHVTTAIVGTPTPIPVAPIVSNYSRPIGITAFTTATYQQGTYPNMYPSPSEEYFGPISSFNDNYPTPVTASQNLEQTNMYQLPSEDYFGPISSFNDNFSTPVTANDSQNLEQTNSALSGQIPNTTFQQLASSESSALVNSMSALTSSVPVSALASSTSELAVVSVNSFSSSTPLSSQASSVIIPTIFNHSPTDIVVSQIEETTHSKRKTKSNQQSRRKRVVENSDSANGGENIDDESESELEIEIVSEESEDFTGIDFLWKVMYEEHEKDLEKLNCTLEIDDIFTKLPEVKKNLIRLEKSLEGVLTSPLLYGNSVFRRIKYEISKFLKFCRYWTNIFDLYFQNLGKKHVELSVNEYTYGCFSPTYIGHLITCLGLCNLSKQNVILDIGHGHGMLLFALSIMSNCACIGVEKSLQVMAESLCIKKKLLEISNQNYLINRKVRSIILKHGTIASVSQILNRVDYLFVLNTKFSPADNEEIIKIVSKSSFTGKIISTFQFCSTNFEELKYFIPERTFIWKDSPQKIFVYVRKQIIGNEVSMVKKTIASILTQQLENSGMTFLNTDNFDFDAINGSSSFAKSAFSTISANVSKILTITDTKRQKCMLFQHSMKEFKTFTVLYLILL